MIALHANAVDVTICDKGSRTVDAFSDVQQIELRSAKIARSMNGDLGERHRPVQLKLRNIRQHTFQAVHSKNILYVR